MAKLIALAKRGDHCALRLVVDRLLPKRGKTVGFAVPKVSTASDIVAAAATVIESAAAGDLSLDEAREFMRLLDSQRRAIETEDLQLRVEALEKELAECD